MDGEDAVVEELQIGGIGLSIQGIIRWVDLFCFLLLLLLLSRSYQGLQRVGGTNES